MRQGLDVGNVLQRVFEIYRAQFGLLIPAALVVFVPVAIIDGLVLSSGLILAFVIAFLIAQIGVFLYQGMVVEAAQDMLDGRRDQDVGGLVAAAASRIGPLLGAGILASIAISIGFVLLIAPGLYLMTIWAVIIPVIVLERAGALDSFGRSQRLVKGYGWPVLGVLVCLAVISAILSFILRALFIGISSDVVGSVISELVTRTLIGPLSALAAAVLYFELKRLHGEPVPGQDAATIPQAGAPQATAPPVTTPPAAAPQQEPPAPPPPQQ